MIPFCHPQQSKHSRFWSQVTVFQHPARPGTYADGENGLYLCVAKGGTKSWICRFKVQDLGGMARNIEAAR